MPVVGVSVCGTFEGDHSNKCTTTFFHYPYLFQFQRRYQDEAEEMSSCGLFLLTCILCVVIVHPAHGYFMVNSVIEGVKDNPDIYLNVIILKLLGKYEFLPSNPLYIKWTELICTHYKYEELMCRSALFFLTGFDAHEFNMTWLPVILGHGAEGTSTKTVIHFAQEVNSGKFQKYDYGYYGNMKIYHQHTPPLYDLSQVTAPVALLWANNDWLADPKDVAGLAAGLPNLVVNLKMPLPDFNHIDFIWGRDCKKLVYDKILKYLPFF
ncbi:gastric triacylglycerol lipase-like [Palaemon carinicauda]|uniref:gastric triacylglycerol lipase-like n=1 Tax=Palaemon carinicauda TaxID=392227 RepID=UPI0035B5BF6D